jgi:hypothetical protein
MFIIYTLNKEQMDQFFSLFWASLILIDGPKKEKMEWRSPSSHKEWSTDFGGGGVGRSTLVITG